MPRPVVQDMLEGFSGLNSASDPLHLGPTEVQTATNAKWTLFKGLTPRLGSQRVSVSPLGGPIQSLLFWQQSPSGAQLLAVAGGQLYTANVNFPPPWTFTNQGACAVSSAPLGTMVAFTSATAECVYVGDAGSPWRWDGATLTHLTSTTSCHLAVQNQRLFSITAQNASNNSAQTLSWSSLNNGDDVGVPTSGHPEDGGQAVIRTFGESVITDLMAWGPGLLIGHIGGLSIFEGWSQNDIAIQTGTHGISAETGVYNPRSMAPIENMAFISSPRGAYILTMWGTLQQISQPIDDLWSTICQYGTTVQHDGFNHCIYLLPLSSNTIYGYNYRTQGWFGPWTYSWAGPTMNVLTAGFAGILGTQHYVLAGCSDGYIRQLEVPGVGLDDVLATGTGGNPYTMDVTTKPMFGTSQTGAPLTDAEKAWRWVDVQAQLLNPQSATVTVQTYPTEGVPATFYNSTVAFNNQPDPSPRNYRIQTGSRGQAVTLRIQDTPASNPNGQNVYMSAKATGFNYGRRYAALPPLLSLGLHGAGDAHLPIRLVVCAAALLGALWVSELPLAGSPAVARLTKAFALLAARARVLGRHLVSRLAVRRPDPQYATESTATVLFRGNGLQVGRVEARSAAAEMIQLQPIRYRTAEDFVADPVNESHTLLDPHLAVPLIRLAAGPYPAVVRHSGEM